MKKLLLIAIVTIFSLTTSYAQQADFSITAGFANLGARASVSGFSESDSEAGFFAGLSADFTASDKLHVQPSVLYSNASDLDLLIIPIMAKYYVANSLNLQAGPQAQIALEESVEGFSNFGLGLGVGAGYDISDKFYIEARYGFDLTNRTSDLSVEGLGDIDVKTTINSLTVGIGYKLN